MKVNEKSSGKIFYGWWIVVIGFLLMALAYVPFVSTTSVFMIPVTKELGVKRADFAFYLTILSLTTVVVTSFMGKIMAKGNIKLIMFLGAVISCIGFIGFSKATVLMHFYIYSVLLGIGFGLITTMPISILINNWFGGKIRGKAMGFAFIGSGFGGMVMTPFLNSIITKYGWRVGYLAIAGIFALVLIPSILLLVVKTPEEKGLTRLGETAEESSSDKKIGMTFKEAKKTPMLWMMLISVVLATFGSSAILANSVSFFIQCGFSSVVAASLAGMALGSLIIGKPLVGAYCDKWGIRNGSIYSCIIFALGFIFLYFMPHAKWMVYLYIVCYCLGGASITVCPPLMINGLFGDKDYGTIVGIVTMATSIGAAFGAPVAAKFYDITGSYTVFWISSAVALTIAGILCGACFSQKKKYDSMNVSQAL